MQLGARSLATAGAVALALANLGRAPGGALGGRDSPVILVDLVTLLVCGFLVLGVASGRVRPTRDRVMAAVSTFLLVAALSTILALRRYSTDALESVSIVVYLIRWVAYFAWYPFVVWALSSEDADRFWRNIERAILVFCVFGIFQSAFLPGFAQMLESASKEWDVQGRRLVSTVLDPNFAGIFVVIALLTRLARLAESIREKGLVLAVLGTGLLLTLSRSALLGFVIGIMVIVAARGLRLRLVKVFLAGAILLLPFISLLLSFASGFNKLGVDGSAAQRLIPWTRAVILVRDHPWLGIGFNAYTQAQQARGWRPVGGAEIGLDGGLLFLAAMTGIIGVFCYVRFLGRVVGSARRIWRDSSEPPEARAHATAVAACLAAVLIHSLFVNSLFLPFVMLMLWVMWGRLAHMAKRQTARIAAGGSLPLLLLVSGCDPCAGVAHCGAPDAEVVVTGAIVHHVTGEPIEGAVVEARFPSTAADDAAATDTTNDEGLWTIRATVPGAGPVSGSFTVTAPGHASYVIPAIELNRPIGAGDAVHVGQWVEQPFIQLIATIIDRGSPLSDATVIFNRTGGVPAVTEIPGSTGGSGNFVMYIVGPQVGTTVGGLTIEHPVGGTTLLEDVPVSLGYRWTLPGPIGTFRLQPRLAYGGATIFLGTGKPTGNVRFEFVRTGGIDISPRSFVAVTRPDGYFNFEVTPLASGEVIGDVTIRPPTGAPRVYRGVRMATFNGLFGKFIGDWYYGEAWKWSIELRYEGTNAPVAGTPVQFRRTSGLMIEPTSVSTVTDASGVARFSAVVLDTGTVVGELVVTPASRPQYIIPNISLRTNPDNEFHSGGIYRLPSTP